MKRFYKEVTVGEDAGGYCVMLDGRKVKTPARAVLRLPEKALAELVAAEWAAQSEKIRPEAMVVTKCANTAADRMAEKRADFEKSALAYANDLLCYRSISPQELVAEQAAAWDPLLAWFAQSYGVTLKVGQGIAPIRQDDATLDALRGALAGLNGFALVALTGVADLTGSLVLAFAVADGRLEPAEAFAVSRLEEDYQMKMWGRDDEAVKAADAKCAELVALGRFLKTAHLKAAA